MRGYDIIGDVHGCAAQLLDRLIDLGYRRRGGEGAFTHDEYHAVFVGDLIDRGPQQRETLELVKAMVDAGTASITMGNHEFNAVCYATEHPEHPGRFLRERNAKHTGQHQAFLDQLTPSQQRYYVEWFKTLPLWLTLDPPTGSDSPARVVHACWHEPSMEAVRNATGDNRLTTLDQWVRATDGQSGLYEAVEVLLKGPEIDLVPYGISGYRDKDGNFRDHARVCWWKAGSTTLSHLAELEKFGLSTSEVPIRAGDDSFVYRDPVPVFYGHYWRQDLPVHNDDFTAHTACVDFSAVSPRKGGGTLVAYRWGGESVIDEQRYVPHGAAHKATIPGLRHL
jgi:hypothetical protein